MDFYSALKDLVAQIPAGKIAFLGDIAEALGDRMAAVALPKALARISVSCGEAKRVLRADGSPIIPGSLAALKSDGVPMSGLIVKGAERFAFTDFVSDYPLRRLRNIQQKCAGKVVLRDGVRRPRTVAGVDVSYYGDRAIAAAVLIDPETLHAIAEAVVDVEITFPYIPSYLAFRELPPLLAALRSLPSEPSLLFVDGHGILHPAKCGIAAQLGITAKIPTIGVGKSYLVGEINSKTIRKGAAVPVRFGGKIMGYAFRSSESRHPILISPGNLITPKTALRLTRAVCLSRVPEPIRQAHVIATEKRRRKNDL